MRLKSLKLKGFKSFADETVIHFDHDVIGIVGPNGSGKSNIVDAIRWVLGEQKGKELRLESMGDIIFNGTKKRKGGNVAQVAITFENTRNILPTEYQSVEITRLLYRSGESEYRLNGVTCRLKDIRELLLDTGIGSNSYAIIALGMVDDILHDKDNARRRMFEQAAGISKYKQHKHETLLKLKSTTIDLDRVDDLLFEIEGNLKTLETQARRTKQYRDLKEKYKDRSLQLAVRKNAHLNLRYKELSKQMEDEKDVLHVHEANLHKKEAELEKIKKESLDGEKVVSEKQRELNILIGRIRSMESEKGLLEQRTAFLHDSVRKLEKQNLTNSTKLDDLRKAIEEKSHTLNAAAQKAEALKEEVRERQSHKERVQQTYDSARSQREHFSSTQQNIEDAHLDLEKRKATYVAQLEQSTTLKSAYEVEMRQLQEEISKRKQQQEELSDTLAELKSQLLVLETDEESRRNRIRELQDDIVRQKDSLHVTHRAWDSKQNECDLLEEMVEKLEGYPESIKYLSRSTVWNVKAPLLSDIIYCDPIHRAKVEFVLAPYLNHFVVETVDEAARAIQLLSNAQKGRAQFFILDHCHPVVETPDAPPDAQPLMTFLEFDVKYTALVKALLGHVFVTDRSPADNRYADEIYAQYTFADQAGIMFRSGATISGGSVGVFEGNRLGRAKNLEHLREEIARLRNEHEQLSRIVGKSEDELTRLQDADKADDVDALRRKLSMEEQRLAECNAHLRNAEAGYTAAKRRLEETVASLALVRSALGQAQTEAEELRRKMDQSSSDLDDMDADFHRLLNDFSDVSAQHQDAHLAYVQQCNTVERMEHEISFRNQQMEELRIQLTQDKTQCDTELQSIGEIGLQMETITNDLIELYSTRKNREADLSASEQKYFEARNVIHELEEKIRSINREHQNSQFLINELKEEHNEIRFKLAAVSERLQIEFHTSLEEMQNLETNEEVPLEELEMKVDRMRKRIEGFGEINPMALEVYDEMKERYDSINTQRQDILNAKQSLLDTIQEIDNTATQRFTDAFGKIREYFIEVFRHLFTEDDTCDLILLDPSKPLESEIEIMAKPKGKRPKSLSQLSGGEKTLTATALLFSLYLLKPAPFCVFDEVDAPLDDANIQKFNKIIQNFSRDSQFVIVTHNKQTMAAVDVIYGVYMEEQGISNLSPVDFRFLEHEEVLEEVEV